MGPRFQRRSLRNAALLFSLYCRLLFLVALHILALSFQRYLLDYGYVDTSGSMMQFKFSFTNRKMQNDELWGGNYRAMGVNDVLKQLFVYSKKWK